MKYHHGCSALRRLHTYSATDVPSGLRTRRAAERRRIRIPTPAERRPAYGGELPTKCKPQTRGGPLPCSNFPCGTKPKGRGGGAPNGGWAPPLVPWAKGEAPSFP